MKIEIDDTVLIDAIVEQWQARLLKVHTPATVDRNLAGLKHMFTKAVDWNMASEETLIMSPGITKSSMLT